MSLNNQVECFWESESLGTNKPYKSMLVEDRHVEWIINSTISKSNDHYCMGLLWKHDPPVFPLTALWLKYAIVKDHARKLTKEEAGRRSNKTWFLPHHLVTSPNKPGKVVVVFDAAAKFQDTSLNDQLLQGPDYINLAGVLMRFRQEEVDLVTDIEQTFHQVQSLWFLWWRTLMMNLRIAKCRCTYLVQLLSCAAPLRPYSKQLMTRRTNVAKKVQKLFDAISMLMTSKSIQTISQAATLAVQLTSCSKTVAFICPSL